MALLTDKVVLVSGGTQGVGAGVARAAAGEGAAAELQAAGAKALFVQADVADVAQAQGSVAAVVVELGRVDCLVNAAGLTARGSLLDTTPELLDAHIAVNLRAPFFLMQAAVKDMQARKAPGTIVNIISSSELGGQPYLAPYVAAKAGPAGLTRHSPPPPPLDRTPVHGLDIGWARNGAFHAQPLTDLPVVASRVVTAALPAVTAEVAARLGAEPADSPVALL